MRIKIQATVTYVWEEDSELWGTDPQTPEELLAEVKKHLDYDPLYMLDADINDKKIEIIGVLENV